MNENNILHHLIEIEKNAAKIVEEAQSSAAAQIAESERNCRIEYENAYRAEYNRLEAEYNRGLAEIDAAYKDELDALKAELERKTPNWEAFNKLAREFFACAGA
ncbi:MAG: hypothetical protein Pg6A_02410 [Termitinemataceae bacterium]|jgi:phage host-nuclease inhibitor protein Gam|nr:MAG: hypothetical protein Pg6A_02410 [Termitinemataceae bacterium]